MTATVGSAASRVLYDRMHANLIASFERYATGSAAAAIVRVAGAEVAVFPSAPERTVYNNAVLARNLDECEAHDSIREIDLVYAEAGIAEYAVWAHESDVASIARLREVGYRVDTWTRAMAMSLDALSGSRPQVDEGPRSWPEYLRLLTRLGGPEGLLSDLDPRTFAVRIAALDGEPVAAAIAYDHDGDCGIYNVGTLPHARRRGLGSALTALHLFDARDRGCTTASLQATEMAEGLYGALGFRNLGRFIEYVR